MNSLLSYIQQNKEVIMNIVDIRYINNKYKLWKKVSEGAFGQIYLVTNLQSNNKDPEYAAKIESLKATSPQLTFECKLYHQLHTDLTANEKGIPMVYYCGVEGEYNVLVMELMGPSLQSLFQKCHRKFTLKTVLMLIDQMIQRIQYIHSRQIIHRDIKPDNFCMGIKLTSPRLYLIDFGLAKRYMARKQHIPYRDGKSLTGTARYASIFTHQGIEQSRRDDLQAIAYVSLYLLKGSLPWQGQRGNNREEKYQRIKDKKLRTTTDELCRGSPREFYLYLQNVKGLQFEQKPDYDYLKNLFRNLFQKNNFINDKYDWEQQLDQPQRKP